MPFLSAMEVKNEETSETNISVLQDKFFEQVGVEFSIHAVERMLERKVSPHDIYNALVEGTSKPQKNGNLAIVFRAIKVITNEQKNKIITVYFKDEIHNIALEKISKKGMSGRLLEVARDKEVAKQREQKIRNSRDKKTFVFLEA